MYQRLIALIYTTLILSSIALALQAQAVTEKADSSVNQYPLSVVNSPVNASPAKGYVGSEACAGCHTQAVKEWQKSYHWHAMQPASDVTVLGDFNDSQYVYNGITSRFYKRGNQFFVSTDNAKGELQEYLITYTFGVYPLQQYLIDFPDGRKQVLSITWDSREKNQGGQRWYHLYPEDEVLSHGSTEPIDHKSPLHWTGSYFNWNSRCASCHSTELQKNYNTKSNTYNTQWQEITVGCESCHGKASQHIEWAQHGKNNKNFNKGFPLSLADTGIWTAVQQVNAGTPQKKKLAQR